MELSVFLYQSKKVVPDKKDIYKIILHTYLRGVEC